MATLKDEARTAPLQKWWAGWNFSPRLQFIACLILAIIVRVIVIVQAHGMMEGDEAILGIQAERLLHGEFPVYIPQQVFLGTWDAYLLAPLIAIFGPGAWLIHSVTLAESLLLVPLLGSLAGHLYGERARLIAMLLAAVPSFFVAAGEIHMLGGYVETMILGSGLMLLLVKIAERWSAGQNTWSFWGLVGLLAGLGIWIDELILYYFVACTIWFAPVAFAQIRRVWREKALQFSRVGLSLASCLAGLILGAFPSIIFALGHQFSNYTFFFAQHSPSGLRLDVATFLLRTGFPDLIAGHLLWIPASTPTFVIRTLGHLAMGLTLLAVGYVVIALAIRCPLWRRDQQPLDAHRLYRWWAALFPVLVLVVIALIYWRSPSVGGWHVLASTERYLLPANTALTLILAYFFTDVPAFFRWLGQRVFAKRSAALAVVVTRRANVFAIALLALQFVVYLTPYRLADSAQALQSSYNPAMTFPSQHRELLDYLDQQHIRYVWANHWLGNIVMYLKNEQVLCADYVEEAFHLANQTFPEVEEQVRQADRPSFIIMADPAQGKPAVQKALDALQITYSSAHFGSIWVITPQTRTVHPEEIADALYADYFAIPGT